MSIPSPIEAGGNSPPSTFSEEKQVEIPQTDTMSGSHVICSVSKGVDLDSWGYQKRWSKSLSCFCERSEIVDVCSKSDVWIFGKKRLSSPCG